MASSFLSNNSRQVFDIKQFLRDAAVGGNSIKYRAESGKRHQIYVPFVVGGVADESGNMREQNVIIAQSANVHEWTGNDGKFKTMVCLKDYFRKTENGDIMNDGSCPFCDNIQKGWNIYNYRYKLEEDAAIARGLAGEQLELYMKGDGKNSNGVSRQLMDERKAKDAKTYLYLVVALYRVDAMGNPVMSTTDNLPEFDLKVMKISPSRAEKIMKSVENSGAALEGVELVFDYPVNEDPAQVVGQSSTAVVFPGNKLIDKFPGLQAKIHEQATKFSWDGIEKAFPELEGMTVAKAQEIMTDAFAKWDKFQEELKVNPNAKYMEYSVASTERPSIEGGTAPAMTGGIPMPQAGSVPMPGATVPMPQVVGGQIPQAGVQIPQPTGVPQSTMAGGVAMPVGGAGTMTMPAGGAGVMPQAAAVGQVQAAQAGTVGPAQMTPPTAEQPTPPPPAVEQFKGAGVSI